MAKAIHVTVPRLLLVVADIGDIVGRLEDKLNPLYPLVGHTTVNVDGLKMAWMHKGGAAQFCEQGQSGCTFSEMNDRAKVRHAKAVVALYQKIMEAYATKLAEADEALTALIAIDERVSGDLKSESLPKALKANVPSSPKWLNEDDQVVAVAADMEG